MYQHRTDSHKNVKDLSEIRVNIIVKYYRKEVCNSGGAYLFSLRMTYTDIKQFYKSREWQRTREAYYKYRRGLCERCLAKGIVSTGDEVHHKVRLTRMNLNDPNITVNFKNLELLCTNCHINEHRDDRRSEKRYSVNADGSVDVPLVNEGN